jgi:hypothetical protein
LRPFFHGAVFLILKRKMFSLYGKHCMAKCFHWIDILLGSQNPLRPYLVGSADPEIFAGPQPSSMVMDRHPTLDATAMRHRAGTDNRIEAVNPFRFTSLWPVPAGVRLREATRWNGRIA